MNKSLGAMHRLTGKHDYSAAGFTERCKTCGEEKPRLGWLTVFADGSRLESAPLNQNFEIIVEEVVSLRQHLVNTQKKLDVVTDVLSKTLERMGEDDKKLKSILKDIYEEVWSEHKKH